MLVSPAGEDSLQQEAFASLSKLAARTNGAFRGVDAVGLGMTRNQLTTLRRAGVIEQECPNDPVFLRESMGAGRIHRLYPSYPSRNPFW